MLHCPAAKPRVATGQGREVFFPRHRCSVERTEGLMGFLLLGYIYFYILLLCYIAICLYIYIGIALFVYFSIACLQHRGITFFISIFYFCSLLRPLFFYDSGSRLSIIWLFTLQRYGGSVRYQTPGMPYSAKTFPERLPQMLHIWVFQKTFYRIVWCSDSWNHHFLMHVKRLYDDEMTE